MTIPAKHGSRWTEEELFLVLPLYEELEFGQLHARNPAIVAAAKELQRTADSVAMKLCNFASLDVRLDQNGLAGASTLDKQVWPKWRSSSSDYRINTRVKLLNVVPELRSMIGPTQPTAGSDREALVRRRVGQHMFRNAVLANFGSTCCITGLQVPQLLSASHIVPWARSEDYRLDANNGLCLAKTQDAAFDRGLITLNDKYEVVVSSTFTAGASDTALREAILQFEGKSISRPSRILPSQDHLEYHRSRVFVG